MYNKFKQYEPQLHKRLLFILRSFIFYKSSKKWFDFIKKYDALYEFQRDEMHRFITIPHRHFYDTRLNSNERVGYAIQHMCRQLPNIILATIELKNGKNVSIVMSESSYYKEGLTDLSLMYEDEFVYNFTFTMTISRILIGNAQATWDESKDKLKYLTKQLHGAQPKFLLMTVLREIADLEELLWIEGVRTKHHPRRKKLLIDYDTVWEELGGSVGHTGNYQFPIDVVRKPITEYPSKKRAQITKKYAMYDDVIKQVRENWK